MFTMIIKNSLFLAFTIMVATLHGQWSQTDKGLVEKANIKCLAVKDGTLFAALSEGVYASTDNGASWEKKNMNDKKESSYLQTLFIRGDSILAGGSDDIYVSADKGNTWFPSERKPRSMNYERIFANGPLLYYGCYAGLYFSSNQGNKWTEITSTIKRETYMNDDGDDVKVKTIRYFIAIDKSIFAGTSSGVYLTSDEGRTWESRNKGLPNPHAITFLEKIGEDFFCSTGNGLYISADKGISWKKAESTLPKNTTINCVIAAGNTLYAAVWQKGIYVSTDKGATWSPFNTGLPKKFTAWSLLFHNNHLYAGGVVSGLWVIDLKN
jgi:photosystem II stability/assembly factor-like uncharacterized protein